jgi:hypothetical protein
MATDLESFVNTAIFFAIVSAAVYVLLIRPILPHAQLPTATQPRRTAQNDEHGGIDPSRVAIRSVTKLCTDAPPHLEPNSRLRTNAHGANVLIDGLLAFQHTRAATYRQNLSQGTDSNAINRKDRARILSHFLKDGALAAPPEKGSTIAISVPENEVCCTKLKRILYLLGTYYNVFVILVGDEGFVEIDRDERLRELRAGGGGVPVEVIPDHRIVATTTVPGRVAFVRQVQRIELVLDFDSEIYNNLTRFGHRVLVYGAGTEVEHQASRLGNDFLS